MNDCGHIRDCHQATPGRLSVIIPCYNAGRYLSEAIESVLSQESSVKCLEIIVVNDHSSDPETLNTLARWKSCDSRVRVLDNTGQSGAAAARNVGVDAATSEWLAFLDADDVWLPGGLQARWQVVEGEPDTEWVSADVRMWHEDGSIDKDGHYEKGDISRQILSQAYETGRTLRLSRPVAEFLRTSLACTDTVMVKRSLLLRLGAFELSLRQAMDLHMWIRLAREADFFFVPTAVALYRQHAASLTHEDIPPDLWSIEAYTMLLGDPDFQPYRSLIRRKLAYFYAQNAYYHRRRGGIWSATRSAAGTLRYAPTRVQSWRHLLAAALGRR